MKWMVIQVNTSAENSIMRIQLKMIISPHFQSMALIRIFNWLEDSSGQKGFKYSMDIFKI